MLSDLLKMLETIKNNLQAFLERKRRAFPRFYFLSDDDLLQILGQARDPHAVRPHLKKCFASLADVDLQAPKGTRGGRLQAVSMSSLEGEVIPFPPDKQTIATGYPVEVRPCTALPSPAPIPAAHASSTS